MTAPIAERLRALAAGSVQYHDGCLADPSARCVACERTAELLAIAEECERIAGEMEAVSSGEWTDHGVNGQPFDRAMVAWADALASRREP